MWLAIFLFMLKVSIKQLKLAHLQYLDILRCFLESPVKFSTALITLEESLTAIGEL